MPDEKMTPEEQSALDEKQLHKQLGAYVEVAKHKLGRTPTLEEVQNLLSGGKAPGTESDTPVASEPDGVNTPSAGEAPPKEMANTVHAEPEMEKDDSNKSDLQDVAPEGEPKILHLKVYFGLSPHPETGEKQADPHKVLFYEDPVGGSCYDCQAQEWLAERPEILEHLSSRPVQYDEKDIVGAIAHGVMDDSDYAALEKVGMLGETPKRLWELTKRLQTQVDQYEDLQKSAAVEGEEVDPDYEENGNADKPIHGGDDVMASMMEAAAGAYGDADIDIEALPPSEENIQKIMAIAFAKAKTGMEDQIREIVREEMELMMHAYGNKDETTEEFEATEELPPNVDIQEQVE